MELILENNNLAFEELYGRYKAPVFSYLTIKLDVQRAEDVHQEIFIKLIRYKDTFKGQSKFKTWLWSIVKNTVIDVYRSEDHQNKNSFSELTNEEGEEVFSAELQTNEEIVLSKTNKDQLKICINELDPNSREVVLLNVFGELSNQEIAEKLKISLGAVKSMLFRSKEKLISCFKRGGHL